MRLSHFAAGSLAPLVLAATLAFGAPVMADPIPSTVSVSASADVSVKPDVVQVGAGVVTQAPTAAAAMAANAKQMELVFDKLKKSGIASKNIRTSGLNLSPTYAYENNSAPKLLGYQASNTVTVRLEDISRIGSTIDGIVAAGVNQIEGIMFSVKDEDFKLDAARVEASKKATAKAQLLAGAMGMKLGRLVSVSEGGGYSPPMPVMAMAKAADAATTIAPGEMQLSATINATYELTN